MENLVTLVWWEFFGDEITMTSLKYCHNWYFKVRFRYNQFEKPLFGQITQIQVIKIEDQGAMRADSPQRLEIFENLMLK